MYENIFVLLYIITVSYIGYVLDDKMKNFRYTMDKTWFIFYSITVLFISIPVALIVATLVATMLMYII